MREKRVHCGARMINGCRIGYDLHSIIPVVACLPFLTLYLCCFQTRVSEHDPTMICCSHQPISLLFSVSAFSVSQLVTPTSRKGRQFQVDIP
uniref:Uncharacterized protein n=1 Tax=Picea glauca TaxID=3330 RepID=A0A101LYI4_PICGL|nr:hypothetical protein ABT39_MTgene5734 [Picea glauca]QHR86681.1 hypothetical protein Q903MT_gene685 [Picea sitchensis]